MQSVLLPSVLQVDVKEARKEEESLILNHFSQEKYKHHTPWPAFKNPVHEDSLTKKLEHEEQESSDTMAYKVLCGKCGNPLGHEFLKDGPDGVGSRF